MAMLSGLPDLIRRTNVKWKIQITIQMFVLQDSRATKFHWEEIYSER